MYNGISITIEALYNNYKKLILYIAMKHLHNESLAEEVQSKDTANIDKVIGTIKLIRNNTGTVVKTWSNVQFSGPNIINYFTFNRINQLEQKGTYYATATIKLYSGTILKETVTVKTSSDTY